MEMGKDMMEEVKLNIVVFGKTGHGMSATANTILSKGVNKITSNAHSETKEVSYSFGNLNHYMLLVVDCPGLDNTHLTQDKHKKAVVTNLNKAIAMCYGGVDAFLFVFRFASKMTREDKSALDALKQIFGDKFMKHVIIVMTYGDQFYITLKEDIRKTYFEKWCKAQTGEFQQLLEDCESRVVLFHNTEIENNKTRAQVQQIVQLTHNLQTNVGRYTSLCLQVGEHEPEKQDGQIRDHTVSETEIKKETEELNFILLGKTGVGKSSTGNLMLGTKYFKTSDNTTSETKDVQLGFEEFGSYKLIVVHGPGLQNTHLNPVEDKEAAITNAEKALALCYGGVDAFLFVFKYGGKFTQEDRFALECLKQIFGDRFMDHVIVVVTAGDVFEMEKKNNECDETFDQWLKKQTGPFRELCDNCNGRVALVNNFEKDKHKKHQQVDQIVKHAVTLHTNNGRYTSECFQKAETDRENLILKQKAPILKKEFQENMCILNTEILNLSTGSSNGNKANIKARIEELKKEIKQHDKGFGVLNDLLTQMEILERSLHYVVKL